MTEREPRLFILVVRGRLQVALSFLCLPVMPAPVLPAPPCSSRPSLAFPPLPGLPAPSVLPTPYPVIPAFPLLSFPRPPSVIPAVFSGNPQVGSLPTAETQTAGFPINNVGNDRKRATPFHSCCGRSSSGHAVLPAPPWPSRPFGPSHALSCHSRIPPSVIPAAPLCHSRSF